MKVVVFNKELFSYNSDKLFKDCDKDFCYLITRKLVSFINSRSSKYYSTGLKEDGIFLRCVTENGINVKTFSSWKDIAKEILEHYYLQDMLKENKRYKYKLDDGSVLEVVERKCNKLKTQSELFSFKEYKDMGAEEIYYSIKVSNYMLNYRNAASMGTTKERFIEILERNILYSLMLENDVHTLVWCLGLGKIKGTAPKEVSCNLWKLFKGLGYSRDVLFIKIESINENEIGLSIDDKLDIVVGRNLEFRRGSESVYNEVCKLLYYINSLPYKTSKVIAINREYAQCTLHTSLKEIGCVDILLS